MNKSRHVNGTTQQVNTSNLVEKGEKLIQLLRKKINRSIIQYADLKKSKKGFMPILHLVGIKFIETGAIYTSSALYLGYFLYFHWYKAIRVVSNLESIL